MSSQSHPITGVTTLTVAGETRTLACDMNCAAVLHETVGERWPEWLTERFIGVSVDGGRRVQPLSPRDMTVALHALLATDRLDHPRPDESDATLARSIGFAGYADLQIALVRCVMTAFGLPGKFVDDVLAAVGSRPASAPAPGTGVPSAPSPSAPSASSPTASGASPSPSGTASSKVTRKSSRPPARKKPGSSRS